jgi:F-type H+-transporting ATPase subunit epsilon
MGRATIVLEGKRRYGACIGGMLSVIGGNATLVATTFEWAEEIDVKRADASYDRAKSVLDDRSATDTEIRLAEARLKRALVRKGVAAK